MSTPQFSPQDASNLIALAQAAPLQNMKMAAEVSALLDRFVKFHEYHSKPEETPAPRRQRKAPAASEPGGEVV
jgi:hypothetical protein